MKLAIVSHNIIRGEGQGRVLLELAKYAILGGWTVNLVADRVDRSLVEMGAETTRISPIVSRPQLPKVWSFARQADRIVPRLRSQGYLIVGNGFSLRSPHDVNIAHMVHDEWLRALRVMETFRPRWRGWYQHLFTWQNCVWEKPAFAAARRVVAVSEQVRESLVRIGVPRALIEVIPNGVDLDEFHPGVESRALLGLPEGRTLGLFVGDLRSPRKNLQLVLDAMIKAPAMHLAVVGDASGSPFPSRAASLGLTGRVHFLGQRLDVAKLMRASDFCVFPSFYDPFGLVVLEAMASGLPIIASRAAGASQLVSQECGIVIDPADGPALVMGILKLMNNSSQRTAMGAAARYVAESHSWRHMAERYVLLFDAMRGPEKVSVSKPMATDASLAGGNRR